MMEDKMGNKGFEKATIAAGCFWGIEELFRKIPGVLSTQVGYTGGHFPNPTYADVCSDKTGHAEAVEITFDPSVISYEGILEIFWSCHNPTTINCQGADEGSQYRSVIFYHNKVQEYKAIKSKETFQQSGLLTKTIVTEIVPAQIFYRAEEYHQQYLLKQGKQ